MKRLGIILLILTVWLGAAPDDARQANEAYRNGEYAEAESLYRKAIEEEPGNAKLYFNLGNALAQQGKTEEALRVFEQYKTMTDDPRQRAQADYNIGNLYTQTEKWERALEHYKKALRYAAADEDAKHNFELALKKRKEQQKKQQQNQQSQQKNQNRNRQQQQDQNDRRQNRNQQQQQQQNRSDQQQDRNQQQAQQPNPDQISKEQAQKILRALEQKEKELLKEFKKKKSETSNSQNEKDW